MMSCHGFMALVATVISTLLGGAHAYRCPQVPHRPSLPLDRPHTTPTCD